MRRWPLRWRRRGDSSAQTLYKRALSANAPFASAARSRPSRRFGGVVAAYEPVVRRYPASGYSDNALWQAATSRSLAFERFGRRRGSQDRPAVICTLAEAQYPASSLATQASRDRLRAARPAPRWPRRGSLAVALTPLASQPPKADRHAASRPMPAGRQRRDRRRSIRDIKRTSLPDGIRVTVEMDAESTYQAGAPGESAAGVFRSEGRAAVASAARCVANSTTTSSREIRLGRHPKNTTRIVFDMEGVDSYSVFTLYDPYRLVIDFKPRGPAATAGAAAARTGCRREAPQPATCSHAAERQTARHAPSRRCPGATQSGRRFPCRRLRMPSDCAVARRRTRCRRRPGLELDGKFSLARQLGLGVSRVVIDAGHGGHDPGAQATASTNQN